MHALDFFTGLAIDKDGHGRRKAELVLDRSIDADELPIDQYENTAQQLALIIPGAVVRGVENGRAGNRST